MSNKTDREAAARVFEASIQTVNDVFQRTAAQVQVLELLALCLFATHPNPEGVRQMFEDCGKRVRIASERQTADDARAFHEMFCGHLQRIDNAMKAPDAAPGLH